MPEPKYLTLERDPDRYEGRLACGKCFGILIAAIGEALQRCKEHAA